MRTVLSKFIVMCVMMLYLSCSWLSVTRSKLAPTYLCVKTWTATCLSFQLAGINRWRTLPHVAAKKVNNHILQNILNVSFYGLDWINNDTCEFCLSNSNPDEVFHEIDPCVFSLNIKTWARILHPLIHQYRINLYSQQLSSSKLP